ncbi:leucine-rich repeat protein [bacterium]|nr:leucine-rich repeat protein [bacterium]
MKRKLLKNLLISSSVLVLASSVTLGLCFMPQNQNMITNDTIKSTNINHNNKQLSSTNNTNNISNYLNNNPNYFLHDGFYTQLSSNETNVTIGGITYLLNTITNTATVINIEDTTSDLIIPGMIQSNKQFYNVTAIGNGACFKKQLKSISLPNSILSIGADAFANNLLTKVNLPLYLNSLGNNAFSNNPFYEGTVINIPSKCT